MKDDKIETVPERIKVPVMEVEELEMEIGEKMDMLFYPDYKGALNQMIVKNELLFIADGVILFNFAKISKVGKEYCLQVNGIVDGQWRPVLRKILKEFDLISAIISPYVEFVSKLENYQPVPYHVVNDIVNKFDAMEVGESFSMRFDAAKRTPEMIKLFGSFQGKLFIKKGKENFTCEIKTYVAVREELMESTIFESKLPNSKFDEFITNFYYHGELPVKD